MSIVVRDGPIGGAVLKDKKEARIFLGESTKLTEKLILLPPLSHINKETIKRGNKNKNNLLIKIQVD